MKNIFILGLISTLLGCSSSDEPSQKNIREALVNSYERVAFNRLICFKVAIGFGGEEICSYDHLKNYEGLFPSEMMSFDEFQRMSVEERNEFDNKRKEAFISLLTDISKGTKKEGKCETVSRNGSPISIEQLDSYNGNDASIYYKCNISMPTNLSDDEKEKFMLKHRLIKENMTWSDRSNRIITLKKEDSNWVLVGLSKS